MDSPQSRASLRVIKPSPKLNRRLQPKIKSAKAAKNNYSNFAAAVVLAVAGALLALSLSHLAAGVALVTRAGALSGKSSGSSVTGRSNLSNLAPCATVNKHHIQPYAAPAA